LQKENNMRHFFLEVVVAVVVLGVLALFAPVAQAGPELVCWPFDIGNARSLPWSGANWHDGRADYDLKNLAADTTALLGPDTPVLIRMETLRRAAIYAQKDSQAARDLFARLSSRMESAGTGRSDSLAYFDLGYFTAAYKQAGMNHPPVDFSSKLDSYELIIRAVKSRGSDPEMEFGAALVASVSGHRDVANQFIAKSAAAATDGSFLATNLVSHCHLLRIQAASLAELRKQMVAVKN
jgi:hypothetical protein